MRKLAHAAGCSGDAKFGESVERGFWWLTCGDPIEVVRGNVRETTYPDPTGEAVELLAEIKALRKKIKKFVKANKL